MMDRGSWAGGCNRAFRSALMVSVALMALLLASCVKNEARLTFELPADVNGACRVVYYASGRNVGMMRETVIEIAAGKGEGVLPLQYPAIIYLFAPSGREPAALIYAERGDKFRITGQGGDPFAWEISGNKTTEALSAWRLENLQLIKGGDRAGDALAKAVGKYVEANPESEAAAIIFYTYFPRRDNEQEFYRLQALLGKDIAGNERLMAAIGAPDLMTGIAEKADIPGRIILTGEAGYADTVMLGHGKGALLIFRATGPDDMAADTLKALARRKAPHAVAEMLAETDSLNWRRHLKKDTIPGIHRLWLPLGLGDSLALRMAVRRVPFYVVVDPSGKEAYRGSSPEEAIKKFSSLKP